MVTESEKEKETLTPNLFLSFVLLVFLIIVTQLWFLVLVKGIEKTFGENASILVWIIIAFIGTLLFLFIMKYMVKLHITALF